MVHFEEDRGGLGIVDDIAGDPRALVAEVHPNSERSLLLMKDAANQIVADDRVHAIVELDRGGLPTAKFTAVVRILDQIAADERAGGPFLAGDAGLAAAPDHVVADDVLAEGLDVGVVNARRVPQNDTNAAGIDDRAVLNDPVLPIRGPMAPICRAKLGGAQFAAACRK